jgi:gliding motility-associated-like protein
MEVSPEGAAIVAGYSSSGGGNKSSGTNGGEDFWIIKVDTSGSKFWDRNYGGANNDSLQAIFIKCDRGILAGGHSLSGISGDRTHYNRGLNDYWAFKLDVPTRPYFRASDICTGVPLNFYDESDVWPDSWGWDFDDTTSANNSSSDQHPIHTYTEAGVFNVSMTIKEGCQKDTTLIREINVYDNTVLGNLDLGEDFSVCEGTVFQLRNIEDAPFGVAYAWSSGDSTNVIEKDSLGVYNVVMSDRNCSVTDSIEVGDCPTIFIPNVFTPNGDDLNDNFTMTGFGIEGFELLIFNRWGQLIYETNDITSGWDGTVNDRNAQIDVYVFKVMYSGIGTSVKTEIGHITLIR